MLEPIVGFFDKLIDQFTWRRLVFLAVLIAVSSGGLWVFEAYTQSFKLGRIERQIAILEKLALVSGRPDVRGSSELRALSDSLTKQLRETDITVPASYELLPWAKKALAASTAWLVFGLFVVLTPNSYTRTRPETASVVAGMSVVASPFIALATALPTVPWVNYALYPIGHIVLLGLFLAWFSRLLAK
jgi:hypothetical protein